TLGGFQAGLQCPLCGGAGCAWELGYRLCCGCLLSWPWASEKEYEDFYRGARYHSDQQALEGLADTRDRDEEHRVAARSRPRIMAAHGLGSGRLLDVGCGGGAFVAE